MPWILTVLLTVFAPLVVLNLYVGRKITTALSGRFGLDRAKVRNRLTVVLLVLNLLPVAALVTFWLGGRPAMTAFAGESRLIDMLLVYPFWTSLIIVIQLAVLLFLWDIVRLTAVRVVRRPAAGWQHRNATVVLTLLALVSAYSIPTILLQTTAPRVHRVTIPIDPRFSALDGTTILHISDVQGDGRTDSEKVRDIVERANELKPDLVLNSGDMVTTGDAYIEGTAKALAGLEAEHGLYAVVGDHDIFSGNKQKVLDAFRDNGHTILEDTSATIALDNAELEVTFVTYTYPRRPDADSLRRILSRSDPEKFRILLVHQPAEALVAEAQAAGFDLVLAGHTHGGGVAFGLPGLAVLAPASFETRFVSGMYDLGRTVVHVTNGLGFTLAPVRFQAPLELSLLTLSARTSNGP